jgi:hypothetical protein
MSTTSLIQKKNDLECSETAWKKEVIRKDKMNEDAVLWYRNFDSFLLDKNYTIKVSEASHSSTGIAPICCCCFNLLAPEFDI